MRTIENNNSWRFVAVLAAFAIPAVAFVPTAAANDEVWCPPPGVYTFCVNVTWAQATVYGYTLENGDPVPVCAPPVCTTVYPPKLVRQEIGQAPVAHSYGFFEATVLCGLTFDSDADSNADFAKIPCRVTWDTRTVTPAIYAITPLLG